jgi:hypothetical protein
VYENNKAIKINKEDLSWNSDFEAAEKKSVLLNFKEALNENIYGYNTNLVIDSGMPIKWKTKKGIIKFRLPKNIKIRHCLPNKGKQIRQTESNIIVTWTKENFELWTNALDDLVCTWEVKEIKEPEPTKEVAKSENYGTIITIMLLSIAVLLFVVIKIKIKKRAGKHKKNE